jgi:hypothetical protein
MCLGFYPSLFDYSFTVNIFVSFVRVLPKEVQENKASANHLPRTYDFHVYMAHDSRWDTRDLHVVTADISGSVPQWHQDLYPDVKEIGVSYVQQ